MNDDNEILEGGIQKILGKESYGAPTKVSAVCSHMTDGIPEAETDLNVLFECIMCGEIYKVPKRELE